MNTSPQEIIYRRINLLSSLMLAGWLILSLALAMTAILLYGKSRHAERTMQERIDTLSNRVADLTDRLGQGVPQPPEQPRPPGQARGAANGGQPQPADSAQTRPMARPDQPARVSPVEGHMDPDPDRPPGLRGKFFDLKEAAVPDDENPMLLLIVGPKTVEATLGELVKIDPAEADRAGVPISDRTMAAQLFLQTRNPEQAHRWAAATTQADNLAGQAWLVAGLASARMKQHDRAIAELATATQRLPGRPEPLKGLGEAYLAAGRPDEAIGTYQKAVATVPQDTALASRLVDLLIASRRVDDAIRQLRKLVAADPRQSGERARLAQLLLEKNQPDDAIAVLDGTPANATPDARLDLARGQSLMATNKLAEAETAIEKAVNMDALSANGWRLLGLVRLRQQKNAGAIVALERSLAINSDNTSAWMYLGVALANDGKIDEAIEKLQEAVRLNVSSAQTHYTLAVLYVWKKQPDAAAVSLAQAVKLDQTLIDRARAEKVFIDEPADSPIRKLLAENQPATP